MGRPSPSTKSEAPGRRFGAQIEAALAAGASAETLTLRLTLRDASLLTRDPSIPLADISYVGGVMRFLGVLVEKGGVTDSVLDHGKA